MTADGRVRRRACPLPNISGQVENAVLIRAKAVDRWNSVALSGFNKLSVLRHTKLQLSLNRQYFRARLPGDNRDQQKGKNWPRERKENLHRAGRQKVQPFAHYPVLFMHQWTQDVICPGLFRTIFCEIGNCNGNKPNPARVESTTHGARR
jgi:hypothetical protein